MRTLGILWDWGIGRGFTRTLFLAREATGLITRRVRGGWAKVLRHAAGQVGDQRELTRRGRFPAITPVRTRSILMR